MKRGNDGEKMMGPMFPRLHVNDTEKGGPRAPPRNKMALYEQLSITSQRFNYAVSTHNQNNNTANSVPPSSLGGGNDRCMFNTRQVNWVYPSEKHYSHSSELSTPLAQVEQRKKIDDDDYAVPIFIQQSDKCSKSSSREKLSPSNPSDLHPSLKFQPANEMGMLDISIGQEGGSKKRENSNEPATGRNQTVSSISHETGVDLANSVDRLRTEDSGQTELCAESRLYGNSQSTAAMGANMGAAEGKRNSSSEEALQSGDQTTVHDLSYESGSNEDGSCRSLQAGNLERRDSISETSVLDIESAMEITPDDVVGTIGQKHFWKARRAIMNQQRVFAVQVFELHRLIKVQRLIAALPHLLHDDAAYFDKPTNPPSSKKRPLDCSINVMSNSSEVKGGSENPSNKKERSAENTIEKLPSSAQTRLPPSSCQPSSGSGPPPFIVSNDHNNAQASYFGYPQPHGHQWLVPVMSPSEGLVYKPCPAPGFLRQGSGNPMTGSFLAPVYGVPAPSPQYPFPSSQYPFPSFPQYGPHGYFPHYGVPIMSSSAFSGSSIEQTHPSTQESSPPMPAQIVGTVPNGLSQHADEEIEVQGSSSNSPNMLPLFPASPPVIDASKSSSRVSLTDCWPQVIKVVPHNNGVSASQSAARIFQSIQEERKQYDSV